MGLGFKSFPRLSTAVAVTLILLPPVLMGILGAWGLDILERQPLAFHEQAIAAAKTLNSRARELFAKFPETAPNTMLPPKDGSTGPRVVDEAGYYSSQLDWLSRPDAVVLAAHTFRSDRLVRTVSARPDQPDLSDPVRQRLVWSFDRLMKSKSPPGFFASMERGAEGGEDHLYYLQSVLLAPITDLNCMWVAWEIDTRAMERRLVAWTEELPSDSLAIQYGISHWTAEERGGGEGLRYLVPLDRDVLPVWRLSVSLDASQLPAQKAGWRSLFYSVFAVVSVPLVFLAGLFVVSRVRQEVNAAKHKVDFLANVTHELKTPLTSIRMFAETLQMGRSRSEEETRESLAIIGREAERLSRMIERVLEYSRLEQQTKVFNFRPVDLSDVADDAVTLFRAQAAKTAGTRILLDTEPGIPDIIGDRDAIKDVLLNLLSNAVKYGGAGKEINVNLRSDGRWVALEVVDRGQGIPPDEQSKVFDKFYRSNDVLARKVEGTGLGLSICREIAKAHGGTISVKSSVGEGSTFTLRLPVSGGSSGRRTAVRM